MCVSQALGAHRVTIAALGAWLPDTSRCGRQGSTGHLSRWKVLPTWVTWSQPTAKPQVEEMRSSTKKGKLKKRDRQKETGKKRVFHYFTTSHQPPPTPSAPLLHPQFPIALPATAGPWPSLTCAHSVPHLTYTLESALALKRGNRIMCLLHHKCRTPQNSQPVTRRE